ncbi:hypothetical protein ACFRCX_34515 [Streptomyces sp. NPDC056652]|uniref:hypothetical protein n=1 Tax=Streptomyces sp. NPDC056652 TaxID=3345893 RepID=UPI0036AE11D6
MKIWNAARAAGAVLALSLGVSACGGGTEDEGPRFVGAEKLCAGILSGDTARAMETIVGAKTFGRTGNDPLEGTASAIEGFYADSPDGRKYVGSKEFCVFAGSAREAGRLSVNFGIYRAGDASRTTHSASQYPYRLGKRALAGFDSSTLYFECVSSQMDGSDELPARINARSRLSGPEGWEVEDTRATREAHLTVLHAAALAVAKELGCENDGGLPEKVVLEPIADRAEPSGAPAT